MGDSQNPNVFIVFPLQTRVIALQAQAIPQLLFQNVGKGQWVITPNATRIFIQLLQGTPHLLKPLSSKHLEHETQLKRNLLLLQWDRYKN